MRTESAERFGPAKRVEQAEQAERIKRAEQAATPSPSRQIPAAIRRAVSKRDGERCTFVSASGRRCGSRDFLEFHHREPWARHRSHAIDGITLRCRAHNQYEAERDFGPKHMQRFHRRDQPQIAASLPETTASLSVTAGPLTKTPASLPVAAASLTDTTASSSEAAVLLPKTSALFLDTEALLPDPSPPVTLQPELDLNPVCAAWENARDCEAEFSRKYADQNSIPGLICGKPKS
jgi:hypothetical protein